MLKQKEFTMSQYLNNEARLGAKCEYYYVEAKRLNKELIAEQAKSLKFCQRITGLEKHVERLKDDLAGSEAAADSLYQDNMSMLADE